MGEERRRVHLVGIGGIGMSGIAEILMNLGYEVSGSDLRASPITRRLESLGAQVALGHDAQHVGDANMVVVSTAVPLQNPERLVAVERGIPVLPRGEMLAELTSLKRTIAVVGSHGKTTVTAMIAQILQAAGHDPTAVIGGRLSAFGSNARLGRGPFMVVEADESDRSFLHLSPEIAVLTNLDDEHLDAYEGMPDLETAFATFAQRAARTGGVVAGVDDPRLRELVRRVPGRVVTFGIDVPADVRATAVDLGPTGSRVTVAVVPRRRASVTVDLTLRVPGRHNVQNALATLAVAAALELSLVEVAGALAQFSGADRRFQVVGDVGGVVVIDDYAHHPTEIAAVLETARLRTPGRLRVVFQPHRYSRTLRLLDQFATVLAAADDVWLTEVYAASETPIPGATAAALADAITRRSPIPVHRVAELDDIADAVTRDARPGDVVLILGAGSIGSVPERVLARLAARAGRTME